MYADTVRLTHHEPFGTDWNQRSRLPDPAFSIDPIDRDVRQSVRSVAKSVTNRSSGACSYDFVAEFLQCARERRLADTNIFNKLARIQRAACQPHADSVGKE